MRFRFYEDGLRQGLVLLILMTLAGLYAVHLGQAVAFDFRNYHWYNAYSFLHHRFDIDIGAASKQNYFNPILDVINYVIIQSFSNPRIAEFALGSLHGIALYFLWMIALIVFKDNPYQKLYATLAVLLGATGAASIYQIGTTYNESQVSIFIMAGLFIIMKSIANHDNRVKPYAAAGLILGLGFGAKMTAISFILGIFASLCCYKKWKIDHFKNIFIGGTAVILGFLVMDGFWMLKLYHHYHNPLFPLYNNIFHSKYVVASTNVEESFRPKHVSQALLYPFYWLHENMVTSRFTLRDPRTAIVIILSLLFCAKWIIKKVKIQSEIFFLILFFYFSLIFWMALFSIYRYLIPLNFISGVLIIYFCTQFFTKIKIKIIFTIILTSFTIILTKVSPSERIHYNQHFFEIDVSEPLPEHALVLVASRAIAYIVTFFPESNQFVGYYNWLVQPMNPGIYNSAVKVIHQFQGPIYAIFIKREEEKTKANLAINQLAITDQCQLIHSNIGKMIFKLCLLKRT